jgi:hypothetical protein
MGLGNTWSNLLDPKSCDAAAFIDFSCTSCMLHLTSTPTASLVFGGPYRIGGDSGSPVIVNDTAHFASPIVGLPLGEPFVVALGSFGRSAGGLPVDDVSPLTWDADLGGGDSTQMGTFILSHLLDWDGDGIWDVFDNCPITPNHDQANCNLDVEKAKGFPQVGDACDPIACAGLAAEPAVFSEYTVGSGLAVQDRLDVSPLGSNYVASGAWNHEALPSVTVPKVPTHKRFCQTDKFTGVNCNGCGSHPARLVAARF